MVVGPLRPVTRMTVSLAGSVLEAESVSLAESVLVVGPVSLAVSVFAAVSAAAASETAAPVLSASEGVFPVAEHPVRSDIPRAAAAIMEISFFIIFNSSGKIIVSVNILTITQGKCNVKAESKIEKTT